MALPILNSEVRMFTSDNIPEYGATFGQFGDQEGDMYYPNGIAVDDKGRIYVADTKNNRLEVWTAR